MIYHKKCNVYVQSQAGLTTSPTVALAYISIFKRVDKWESLTHTSNLVSQSVSQSHHNEALVEKVVDDNLEFLARQYDRETEEALRIREVWKEEDERNRIEDLKELDRLKIDA